jgi:hypothetical protein
MAKVEVFTFITLSSIFGHIGGLYSMMSLLCNISLMYITRKNYLKSIVSQITQPENIDSKIATKIKERMSSINIYHLYDTIDKQQEQIATQMEVLKVQQ